MANYYVSVNRGSDSTGAGTAPNPWQSIGYALGSSGLAISGTGDWLYIEPGVYREAVNPSSSTSPADDAGRLTIIGDSDGAGFLTGGYATPVTGQIVDWRAWTDDMTAMSASAMKPRPYTTLRNLKITGGGSGGSCLDSGTSRGVKILDCNLIGAMHGQWTTIAATTIADTPLDLLFERCTIVGNQGARILTAGSAADIALNIVFRSCRIDTAVGKSFFNAMGSSSAGPIPPGGVAFQNCTFSGGSGSTIACINTTGYIPASPWTVNGCLILTMYGISAVASGQLTEDGNIFACSSTTRTNVAVGLNSLDGACPSLDFGDHRLTGLPPRPFGCPVGVGVIGGHGNFGTPPSTDLDGRARPEGLGSIKASAGCLERHDTGVQNTTYADTGSPACMALVGPSSQDLPILVDATPTTISVKVRWDGNHGDANKPQAILLPQPEIGFVGQTLTATGTGGSGATPNSYVTLTATAFTPTQPGAVMLRLVSRAATDDGAAYFDTVAVV